MVDTESIVSLSDSIVEAFAPERIVLFGSYAHGTPTEDSDVDLLVILRFEGSRIHKALEILRQVKPRIPVDLIVHTPEEVRQRLACNDFFLREVVEKGQVLYESPHS